MLRGTPSQPLRHKLAVEVGSHFEFQVGEKVQVKEGYLGTVTAVEEGPRGGDEKYVIVLDAGMGHGEWGANELRSLGKTASAQAEAKGSKDKKADRPRYASDDYPELADILVSKPAPVIVQTASGPTCSICGKPRGLMGDPCMKCIQSRAKAAQDGKCHCGNQAIPGEEISAGGYKVRVDGEVRNRGGRSWIPCQRCLGTIRQTSSRKQAGKFEDELHWFIPDGQQNPHSCAVCGYPKTSPTHLDNQKQASKGTCSHCGKEKEIDARATEQYGEPVCRDCAVTNHTDQDDCGHNDEHCPWRWNKTAAFKCKACGSSDMKAFSKGNGTYTLVCQDCSNVQNHKSSTKTAMPQSTEEHRKWHEHTSPGSSKWCPYCKGEKPMTAGRDDDLGNITGPDNAECKKCHREVPAEALTSGYCHPCYNQVFSSKVANYAADLQDQAFWDALNKDLCPRCGTSVTTETHDEPMGVGVAATVNVTCPSCGFWLTNDGLGSTWKEREASKNITGAVADRDDEFLFS